ncbi:hypothetical protein [Methylocaldum szegediense]|uniref:Uncharacterized protein n=1 Tax=Methylocaldum szegediense TaxID=73780 RepID=A0ABN8X962_9GAMM|nr:hypothetical protein [Methylocaldum szegediense]CAI8870203.1 conserved protein of unknown function [Methylocaldum szegediense]
MSNLHDDLAHDLVREVLAGPTTLRADPDHPGKLLVPRPDGRMAGIDLTPFEAEPQPMTAGHYFHGIKTVDGLLTAYRDARRSKPFEEDLSGAMEHVDPYAHEFLDGLLARARSFLSDADAKLIGDWVGQFDVYVAVKAVESLLYSQADLTLLKIAPRFGWTVHFDHLAIRCGSAARGDAERVVENLRRHHGYVPSQVEGEDFYQFEDGWNAYVLYKILENGQVLRLFIDQSDADNPTQIIQHWNHVYGYTAHHLAIRATRFEEGRRVAVGLSKLMHTLEAEGVAIMTPTGDYTDRLLLQVFTRPERNREIPQRIREALKSYGADLETVIENAKLLELVSRREMSPALAERFFALYDIPYEPDNPLHSAPIYNYFLPEQAAHVIRTSVQGEGVAAANR